MIFSRADVVRWLSQLNFDPLPKLPTRKAESLIVVKPSPFPGCWRICKLGRDVFTIQELK